MSLESVDYIASLIATNPPGGDQRSQGDDHIRLLKHVLLTTFPNMKGAVTSSQDDLNLLSGLHSHPTMVAPIPALSFMPFYQATAPTGWIQVTTLNDRLLRVVSGTGGGTGGDWAITGLSVDGHTLTLAEMPTHTHSVLFDGVNYPSAHVEADGIGGTSNSDAGGGSNATNRRVMTLANTGSGGSHSHSIISSGAWRPAYANAIICQKQAV